MYSIALDVLLVTDEPELAATLPVDLEVASQGRLRVTAENDLRQGFDAIMVDLGANSPEWLERAHWRCPGVPLLVLMPEPDHPRALQCLRHGAQEALTRAEVEGQAGYRALRYAVERSLASRREVWGVQQQARAEKMEAVGRLAAAVVHDFRHLVQIVVGNCSLMIRQHPEDETLLERLSEVRDAAQRANQLIDRLLQFAREGDARRVALDLGRFLDRSKVLIRPLLGHRIRLESSCAENCIAWANETEADQILMNLVVNAVDAMPAGGWLFLEGRSVELGQGLLAPHCRVSPGRYVVVSVADTGTGMSAELLLKVLEPFFTTKTGTGTGLGLSSVYTLASAMGGGLLIASEPGAGTCVSVLFPSQTEPEAPALKSLGRVVLLLEPLEPSRSAARLALDELGCDVLEARNLEDARRLCSADIHVDLAMVDAGALLGGAAAIEEILPRSQHILLSDFPLAWLKARGFIPPGWRVLQRPWGTGDLLALLN